MSESADEREYQRQELDERTGSGVGLHSADNLNMMHSAARSQPVQSGGRHGDVTGRRRPVIEDR